MCNIHSILLPTVDAYFNHKKAQIVDPKLPGYYAHLLNSSISLGQYRTSIIGSPLVLKRFRAAMEGLPREFEPLCIQASPIDKTRLYQAESLMSPHSVSFLNDRNVRDPSSKTLPAPYHMLILAEAQRWTSKQEYAQEMRGRTTLKEKYALPDLLNKCHTQSKEVLRPIFKKLFSAKQSPIQKHWNINKVWLGIYLNNPVGESTLYLGCFTKDSMPASMKEVVMEAPSLKNRFANQRAFALSKTKVHYLDLVKLSEIHDRPAFFTTNPNGQLDFTSGMMGTIAPPAHRPLFAPPESHHLPHLDRQLEKDEFLKIRSPRAHRSDSAQGNFSFEDDSFLGARAIG